MRVRSLQPVLQRPRRSAPLHLPPRGRRSATALALAGPATGFGDFGGSILGPTKEEIKTWCNANAAKEYAGRMDLCLRCPSTALLGRCQAPAPWTIAGKGLRWAGVVLPSPADYDFETMFVIGATNPAKLAVMAAVAGLVVPIIGASVVSSFAFPLSIASALPLVLPVTAVRAKQAGEKFEDRLWRVVLQPVVKQLGKYAGALIDYAFNGNSALARYAVREVADNLGTNLEAGILMAVAESTQIVDAIRKPELLREEGTLVSLGDLILRISDMEPFKSSGSRDPLRFVADALKTMARPLSILLKKGPGAVPEALDALLKQTLGFTREELAEYPEEVRRTIAQQKLAAQALPTRILRELSGAVDNLGRALSRLPYGAGKAIQGILASAVKLSSDSLGFLGQLEALAKAPPPAPPAPPAQSPSPAPSPSPSPAPAQPPAQVEPSRLPPVQAQPSVSVPPAGPVRPLTPAPSGSALPVLIAGAAGGLAFGPIGAAIGAGIGLAASAKRS